MVFCQARENDRRLLVINPDTSISNDNDDIFAPYSHTSVGCLTSEPLSKSVTRCQAPKGSDVEGSTGNRRGRGAMDTDRHPGP